MPASATAPPEVYTFGPFVFHVSERRFTRGDRAIALAPKALALLLALVRRHGHLVTKRELLDEVWPDVHVEEGVLAVHISAARKAQGHASGAGRNASRTPEPLGRRRK